ncbi:Conserved_hypothetical protein [Hexamita inflata]|uniref:Uncharacterized protein n=1 Tax=Hexamita inflata TaxID=28002 RepID=A0AA86TZQ9_9EUKA|nr:Conserved hypothetical protein [Hexamita inflata]
MIQMLHKHRLFPETDIYLQTKDTSIDFIYQDQIFNTNFADMLIQYQQVYQQFNNQYCSKYYSMSVCKGNIYCQYSRNIYQFTQKQPKYITEIPLLQFTEASSVYSRMFSFNNELYVHDNDKCLYILHNNKLKLVKECYGSFFQFCNNIIIFDQNKQEISFMKDDLSYQLLCKTENAVNVSLAQGGTFIVHSSNCQTVYVVDMINKRVVMNSDISLKHKFGDGPSIFQLLVQGSSGIQLCDQKLIELFGDQFPLQVQNAFSEYIYSLGEIYKQFLCQMLQSKGIIPPQQLYLSIIQQRRVNELETLKFWQLRHLICLKPNVFFAFEDGYYYFIDRKSRILMKHSVAHDNKNNYIDACYSGYKMELTNYQKLQSCTSHLYQSVLCNGEIYVLISTDLTKLTPSLKQINICSISPLKLNFESQLYACIFTLNGIVYILNNSSIYKLVDEKLVFVKQFFGQVYQFCDIVFVFNILNQEICKMDNDLNQTQIVKTKNAFWVSFSSGLLVVHTEHCEHVWVVNMSNSKVRVFKNGVKLHYNNIQQYIGIGKHGLELEMFNAENEELDAYHSQFMNKQNQSVIEKLTFEYLYRNQMDTVTKDIEICSQNIEILTKYVKQKQIAFTQQLEKTTDLYENLCQRFEIFANCQTQQ